MPKRSYDEDTDIYDAVNEDDEYETRKYKQMRRHIETEIQQVNGIDNLTRELGAYKELVTSLTSVIKSLEESIVIAKNDRTPIDASALEIFINYIRRQFIDFGNHQFVWEPIKYEDIITEDSKSKSYDSSNSSNSSDSSDSSYYNKYYGDYQEKYEKKKNEYEIQMLGYRYDPETDNYIPDLTNHDLDDENTINMVNEYLNMGIYSKEIQDHFKQELELIKQKQLQRSQQKYEQQQMEEQQYAQQQQMEQQQMEQQYAQQYAQQQMEQQQYAQHQYALQQMEQRQYAQQHMDQQQMAQQIQNQSNVANPEQNGLIGAPGQLGPIGAPGYINQELPCRVNVDAMGLAWI